MLNVKAHVMIILFGHGCCSNYLMLINSYATHVAILLIHHYNMGVASVLPVLSVVTEQLQTYPLFG